MKMAIFEKNLKFLQKHAPHLAQRARNPFPSEFEYVVESARNGEMTLAIKVQGKSFQVHSKYDPGKEAVQQIKGMNFSNPKILLILGMGLGYQIRAALREFENKCLFLVVFEKDFRAFQVALENVDLTDLFASPKIRWIVGVPQEQAFSTIRDMIKESGIGFQLYLKTVVVFEHPIMSKIHGAYHKHMIEQFRYAASDVIINYGNCPEDSMIGIRNTLENLGVILRSPGVKHMFGAFKNVPGILVSTGPSLDKNVHFLKEAQDKCVMVCADSTLVPLLNAGVIPHGFASIERVLETVKTYRDYPEDKMKDVWMISPPLVRAEGYEAWKGPKMMVFRDFHHFEWIGIPKGTIKFGTSCSNLGFKFLEMIGCNPIILVGQDCSFPSIEKTHAAGIRGNLINKLLPEQLFKVKGNYDEQVLTYEIFEMFRRAFVVDVANFPGRVINSTAGGAFIEGAELMPLDKAIKQFCTQPFDARRVFLQKLRYPDGQEIQSNWHKLNRTIEDTLTEVKNVIDFCDKCVKKVIDFEDRLNREGYIQMEDFLQRFPTSEVQDIFDELTKDRARILTFGKYFDLYLMHVVQMILVSFEMDLNEIPSLCSDRKRGQLQGLRLMRQWFPTIRDVCKLAYNLLDERYVSLKKEFG